MMLLLVGRIELLLAQVFVATEGAKLMPVNELNK